MASPVTVRRVDVTLLPLPVRSAVSRYLGCGSPDALRAVAEEYGGAVILRFSNYGTALAVESFLLQRGFHAEQAEGDPDGYAVRVVTGTGA